jgi:membrane protein implicated in regulation of membrane protease activity
MECRLVGFGVQGGILCAALAGRHNVLFVVFGLAFAIVSTWEAMDRLDDGPSVRSLVWVLIDAAVIGLAIGLATWVYPHGTVVAWVIVGIATVAVARDTLHRRAGNQSLTRHDHLPGRRQKQPA